MAKLVVPLRKEIKGSLTRQSMQGIGPPQKRLAKREKWNKNRCTEHTQVLTPSDLNTPSNLRAKDMTKPSKGSQGLVRAGRAK